MSFKLFPRAYTCLYLCCNMQGKATNCHSFQLAEGYNGRHPHENYTTFTKTLEIESEKKIGEEEEYYLEDETADYPAKFLQFQAHDDDNTSFVIKFMSTMTDSGSSVEFQATITGEILGDVYQVSQQDKVPDGGKCQFS